jgi:hypothetical protein
MRSLPVPVPLAELFRTDQVGTQPTLWKALCF